MGILWALSPAGGQASLRVLYHSNKTSLSSTTIRYMDTGPLGISYTYRTLVEGYDIIPGDNDEEFPFSMSNSLAAALMQNVETKSGPRDLWGNPRIPRLHTLNHSTADEDGWIQVSPSPMVESFSSLFGLPLLGIPDHGTVEFGVESAYVEFGTASVEQVNENGTASWSIEATCTCPDYTNDDQIMILARANRLLGPPWMQLDSSKVSQESLTRAVLVQFTQPRRGTTVSSMVKQVLTETHIVCEEGLCRATKIRPSVTDHRPENITVFDLWGELALDMLREANGQRSGSPTLLELFLNDTSTIPVSRANAMYNITQADWPNLADVEPDVLSGRITLLLNSAIHLLYSFYGFAGTLPSVDSMDYGPPHIPVDGLSAAAGEYNVSRNIDFGGGEYVTNIVDSGAPFVGASTEALVTQKHAIYKADYTYVIILVLSSLAPIVTGLIGMIMGLRTRGPDVFDPLMGLTYNNGSLGLLNPGSTLDANTRAKLMRGMTVRLGDVAGGESVGMVGMGRAPEVAALVQDRLYE